jgi:hypothetical protein
VHPKDIGEKVIPDRSRKMFIWMVTKYMIRLEGYRMYSTGIADRSRKMFI